MIKAKPEINPTLLFQARMNLASNYRDLKQFKEALEIYEELEAEYKNKENLQEANVYNDIALFEKYRKNFAKVDIKCEKSPLGRVILQEKSSHQRGNPSC